MKLKALTSLVLSSLLLFFNTAPVLAASFKDLQTNHWAYKEINALTEKGIIAGYPDKTFKPENTVNRAEFTKMVIKILDKDEMPISTENIFTDINPEFWAYDDILRSKELGLVVGYPDNTFKPYNNITKTEVTSIIAKTIKDDCGCEKPCRCEKPCDCCDCAEPHDCGNGCPLKETKEKNCIKDCVLRNFADNEKVAKWAKKSFKKAIKNELYVNHPDKDYLTPDKEITRAETAAILYKLRKNPSVLLAHYQGPEVQQEICEKQGGNILVADNRKPEKLQIEEYTTVIEHLPSTPYTGDVTEVQIRGAKAKLLAYNVLPVNFEGGFNSKELSEGQLVDLTFTKNVTTQEGTKLIPAGSKLVAQITELKNGKLFHRNGKTSLEITNLVTPNGEVYPLTATIENSELLNKKFGKCNLKRLGVVGGSIAAFGSILGLLIGVLAGETGNGAAIGGIIGGGTGLLAGLISPGCSVKIPETQDVYIKLQSDVEIETE